MDLKKIYPLKKSRFSSIMGKIISI